MSALRGATAPTPPLNLDMAANTYFTLTTTRPLTSLSQDLTNLPSATSLNLLGPLGEGILASTMVIEFVGQPTTANDVPTEVKQVKAALEGLEGVREVTMMEPKRRVKRGGNEF